MQQVDIMEAVQMCIENILYKQWHHDGYIDGFNSSQIRFVVDTKKYILEIHEAS